MTRTERLKDVEEFLLEYVKYDLGNFFFTQHLTLLFCKKKHTVNKDRFVQDCCLVLRENKEKFGIPLHAEITSSYCRYVSPRRFKQDNGYSNKCLYNLTWKDKKKDPLCVEGPPFLHQYLELREQEKSTTKSLYFEPEFSYKDFESEEGLDRLSFFIKNVKEDQNLNHNRNLMFMINGVFSLLRKQSKENKQLIKEIKHLKEQIRLEIKRK